MDRRAFDDRRRIGTVKAAIDLYGERTVEGKLQTDSPEKSSSRAKELHMAKRDVVRYKEGRRTAQSVKTQAESELSNAKKTLKDLALHIEETTSKAKSRIREMETQKSSKHEDKDLADRSVSNHKYAEMMRELEHVKRELSKLKLDMTSVWEEKTRAEKEIEVSNSKLMSKLSIVEALRKEIEDVNEEQVLVELARIEALKEFGEIEALREKEASQFLFEMEKTRNKMKDVIEEIDRSKELESKLAVTLSNVNVLQNETKLVKETEKKFQRNDSWKHSGGSFQERENLKDSTLLRLIKEELKVAKKELASIREEGFQFLSSIEIIRSELKHVMEETSMLKKTEQNADLTVENLNLKLLRAKSKLESVTSAEAKAKSIVSNLFLTLEQLKTQAEVAKKEKEFVRTETANIKADNQKTLSEIDKTEEKLQAAMQELEEKKTSEDLALENLENLIENTMRARACSSKQNSSITISMFEYEYLTRQAVRAEEIADKKVAAAEAWVKALKSNEKEILMKIEIAQREIGAAGGEEERELDRTERSFLERV